MKERDARLANEKENTRLKIKKVEDQLNEFEEIAKLNKLYREEVESLKKKNDKLNPENRQLQMNFLSLKDLQHKEKAHHEQDIERITHAMKDNERYLVDYLN